MKKLALSLAVLAFLAVFLFNMRKKDKIIKSKV